MADILPDVLAPGLALVFCGTAASRISARERAYYANPSNAFWRSLHACGFTPRLFSPQEFRKLLPLGLGLTDLAKAAVGNDGELRRADYHPLTLRTKIQHYQPRIVAFTSKTAWRAWADARPSQAVDYGWQAPTLGRTRFFVLPSPSGAARRYWDSTPWQALAAAYQELRAG